MAAEPVKDGRRGGDPAESFVTLQMWGWPRPRV